MAPRKPFTNVFDLEYYDAAACSIYIGDVLVDEITSLRYSRQQSKTPIYGYASQLWDDCTVGQVIISGSFSINFKEQGYLWAVLRRYKNISSQDIGFATKGDKRLLNVREGDSRTQPNLVNNRGTRVGSNGTAIDRRTIERIAGGEYSRGQRYDFYQDLAGYSTFDINNPRDKTFEDIVEAFEDQIWEPDVDNVDLVSQIRNVDNNEFDNFDMYVVFGNMANPAANHTAQKIVDVRLTSIGKEISVGAGPIQEFYTFVARTTV